MFYKVIVFENVCPDMGSNQEPLDIQSNAIPYELSRHVVAIFMGLYESEMIIMKIHIILQNTFMIRNMDQGRHWWHVERVNIIY